MNIKLDDIKNADIDVDLARLDLHKLGKEIARMNTPEIAQVLNGFSDDLTKLTQENYFNKIKWIVENLEEKTKYNINNFVNEIDKENK